MNIRQAISRSLSRFFSGDEQGESRAIQGEQYIWAPRLSNGSIAITPSSALSLSAYFCAISTIAGDTASLPLQVYSRDSNGDREALVSHPGSLVFKLTPDGETTSIAFRQALMGHVLGHGNGYAEIVRFGNGDVASLHLLDPCSTFPKRLPDNSLVYSLNDGRTLPPTSVLHIRGFGYDGLCGYSPCTLFRQSLSLAAGAETFGNSFFQNASRPAGYLKLKSSLKDQAAVERLRQNWDTTMGGPEKAGKTALLENGAEFIPLSINPEDAQFLTTREFQVLEIARMFRMPPHKLMDYSEAHFNNLESAERYYAMTTLRPWLISIEQELNLKLLLPSEQNSLYYEHNMDGFLRGSPEERTTHYKEMFGLGAFSTNDILRLENRPTIGPDGDRRYVSANLKPNNTPDEVSP